MSHSNSSRQIQNLDQHRAIHALKEAKELKRAAVNGLPGLIINNGLLATASFCESDGGGENRPHMQKAMRAIAKHLSARRIITPNITNTEDMITFLAQNNSSVLQRATLEALAYLGFLKRFAKAD